MHTTGYITTSTCWKNVGESQTLQINSFLNNTETLWSPLNRWENQALMMSWWVQCHMAIETCPWHFTNISTTCLCQALRESVRDKNTKKIYSPKHIHAPSAWVPSSFHWDRLTALPDMRICRKTVAITNFLGLFSPQASCLSAPALELASHSLSWQLCLR